MCRGCGPLAPRYPDRLRRGGAIVTPDAQSASSRGTGRTWPGKPLRRPGQPRARPWPRGGRHRAQRRLPHQRGQALQVRGARATAHPPDAEALRVDACMPWLRAELDVVSPRHWSCSARWRPRLCWAARSRYPAPRRAARLDLAPIEAPPSTRRRSCGSGTTLARAGAEAFAARPAVVWRSSRHRGRVTTSFTACICLIDHRSARERTMSETKTDAPRAKRFLLAARGAGARVDRPAPAGAGDAGSPHRSRSAGGAWASRRLRALQR